ncbi:MAG: glutamine--fructose-6-phosphate transaminase (isomerizing) [Candidatus Iainarchaeum archaeon]|uniref:Glutamine--fructose-6-phosphate aminotransferase [isomerizing] n=1 Tax=Candidatus Iainarchaeum sp. TaxID=3101447 RepID=A0A497JI07_9ARCH|nr:MAG: glutamine--fructose-6-phosphate transaminase (isomerizing) [Candidatus Diapherotrites archaeon]
MCGIFGVANGCDAIGRILLEGLKALEYRGYDSAGMATLHNREILLKKDKGKIDEIDAELNFHELKGNIGIAHTRWATHGKVSKENAHPHLSCNKKIAIVHNGIIENYAELKEELIKKGHQFASETDSEVIAHLIEEELKEKDIREAFINAIKKLKGSYAIICIYAEKPNMLLAAKKDSPLIIGLGNNKTYLASDIVAFLQFTKKAIFLEDYDIVFATKDSVKIWNLKENKEVKRDILLLNWNAEEAKKCGYEHYMLKEIFEQKESCKRALMQKEEEIAKAVKLIKNSEKIFLIGCGTSFHACHAAAYLFQKAGILSFPILASEFENYKNLLNENTLIIAVSQSGETADVLQAVKIAKEKNCKVLAIVNRVGSSLTRIADLSIMMNSGPEICVLATKTFTAQLCILLMLIKKLKNEIIENKFLEEIDRILQKEYVQKIFALAEKLADKESIYLIGRDLQYSTALEAALKIKEVSYIHAEALAGGELKHGTLALIEDGTPVIVFVSEENKERIISNANEVKARGAFLIGVSAEKHKIFDFWIDVKELNEFNPIVQIIPMQLLAYKLALLKGYDPDKPRNLAKSVTVL